MPSIRSNTELEALENKAASMSSDHDSLQRDIGCSGYRCTVCLFSEKFQTILAGNGLTRGFGRSRVHHGDEEMAGKFPVRGLVPAHSLAHTTLTQRWHPQGISGSRYSC